MKHSALPAFWKRYKNLPEAVRNVADKNFRLLKENPGHPSLQFKKMVTRSGRKLWSVRVGADYRAVGLDKPDEVSWFWIGSHSEYDRVIS